MTRQARTVWAIVFFAVSLLAAGLVFVGGILPQ